MSNDFEIKAQIHELLDGSEPLIEECLSIFSSILNEMKFIDRAAELDTELSVLGVRVFNDAKAIFTLINNGYILQSMMIERDMVEIRVLADYFVHNEEKVKEWRKAKTIEERLLFAINKIKEHTPEGKGWKKVFDHLSKYLHPNKFGSVVYASEKEYFGYNLYLGGIFNPAAIGNEFQLAFALLRNIVGSYIEWYGDKLKLPQEISERFERLNSTTDIFCKELEKKVKALETQFRKGIDEKRLSRDQIIETWRILDKM
jgi:hypothetical protein